MTKKELEELADLKNEIRLLTEDIDKQKSRTVSDGVEGSSSSFPYCKHRIVITGIDISRHNKLTKKLEEELEKLQDMLFSIEEGIEAIEESQTRSIVRLYYRNGLTQAEIGQELGYVQSVISRKLKDFTESLI